MHDKKLVALTQCEKTTRRAFWPSQQPAKLPKAPHPDLAYVATDGGYAMRGGSQTKFYSAAQWRALAWRTRPTPKSWHL